MSAKVTEVSERLQTRGFQMVRNEHRPGRYDPMSLSLRTNSIWQEWFVYAVFLNSSTSNRSSLEHCEGQKQKSPPILNGRGKNILGLSYFSFALLSGLVPICFAARLRSSLLEIRHAVPRSSGISQTLPASETRRSGPFPPLSLSPLTQCIQGLPLYISRLNGFLGEREA
jgi:hypothetical protein